MNEKELQELGFKSEQEFHRLVAHADLSSMEKIATFKRWQNEDGSKAGLLKLQPVANSKLGAQQ